MKLATPAEADKFISELRKARMCQQCGLPFFPDCQCDYIDPTTLPNKNAQGRPWGHKGSMTLPKDHPDHPEYKP